MAATATASDSQRLSDVAAALVAAAKRSGVDFAQVFAEDSAGVRKETTDGTPTGVVVVPRAGIGCTVQVGRVWRHRYATGSGVNEIREWLAAVGRRASDGTRATTPRSGREQPGSGCRSVLADELRAQLMPVDIWKGNVDDDGGGAAQVRFTEDVVVRRFAVADTQGRGAIQDQRHVRHRVEATVLGSDGPCRGWARSVYAPNCPDAAASVNRLVVTAVTSARDMAIARAIDGRCTPVVLGPGAGAALLHELIGHPLEDDNALVAGRQLLGLRVAPACLTVCDDPGRNGGYGALKIDDEGTPAARTMLVEDGVVCSCLTTVRSAARSGAALSGNGRREDYRFATLPRATNTVVQPGPDQKCLLLDTSAGDVLYIRGLASGEVDPVRGTFRFAALDGMLLTVGGDRVPVRDAVLAGDTLETLSRLESVASDQTGDNVTCGKQGQSVGIGLFSPTMRFADLTWRAP